MRTLTILEMGMVAGGDGEREQEIACATSLAAVTGYLGITGATAEATASGVLSVPAIAVCQTTTAAIGSSLAAGVADLQEGFNDLIINTESAFLQMQSVLNLGTLGL